MEDLVGATAVKIHLKSCGFFARHSYTETTRWHSAKDLNSAIRKAQEISRRYKKGWRKAKCCFKN